MIPAVIGRRPGFCVARLIAASAALALAVALAAPAVADGGPQGIGFAQAEEGTWWCQGDAAADALACAMAKCDAEAGGQDCHETAWCFPARWSGLMTVFLEDFHTTRVVCGAPSKSALTDTFRLWCAAHENADHCEFILSIDPDGSETEGGGETFPGPP